MRTINFISATFVITALYLTGCSEENQEKGFAVSTPPESRSEHQTDGLSKDSISFKTKPGVSI